MEKVGAARSMDDNRRLLSNGGDTGDSGESGTTTEPDERESFWSRQRGQPSPGSPGGSEKERHNRVSSAQNLAAVAEQPGCLIYPDDSKFLLRWDVFIAMLLVVVTVLAPFETAFLEPQYDLLFCVNRLVDSAFAIDLVLQFFIVRKDENNKEVVRHCEIAKLYFKGWFWVDFSSIIPVDLAMMLMGRKTNSALDSLRTVKVVRLMRFLRLVRLLRLSKFQVIIARWHANIGVSYALISLLKNVVLILLMSHWMACVWGFLAMQDQDGGDTWLDSFMGGHRVSDPVRRNPGHVYLLSLYWAVATLTSIGYGDIVPTNELEFAIGTLCMLIMAGLWAYVIGAMCSVVSTMHPHENIFRQNMDAFNEFMEDFSMPGDMRKKLRRFFYESKDILRQRVEKNTIDLLSPALQGEVLYFLHHDWLGKIWYFRDLSAGHGSSVPGVDRAFIIEAARCLELKLFGPGELVARERTLFIVRRGICMRMSYEAHMDESSQLPLPLPKPRMPETGQEALGFYERRWPRIYIRGGYWGEDFFLSNEMLRDEVPATALSYTEVITFDVKGLTDLLPDFPEVKVCFLQARIKLALTRALKKISRVFMFYRTRKKRSHSKLSIEILDFIGDIIADRLPIARMGQADASEQKDASPVTASISFGNMSQWRGTVEAKKKANLFKHAHISSSLKTQPVVGRLEHLQGRMAHLQGKVDHLADRQEHVERTLGEMSGTLNSVCSMLQELTGKADGKADGKAVDGSGKGITGMFRGRAAT